MHRNRPSVRRHRRRAGREISQSARAWATASCRSGALVARPVGGRIYAELLATQLADDVVAWFTWKSAEYSPLSGILGRRQLSTGASSAVAATALREHIDKSGVDQAFFHVNLSEVVRQYVRWCDQLPRVKPHYAVKCNNDPRVLATLADLGCDFDCASASEMDALLDIGVAPERIIYANPCKSHSQLRYARTHNVNFTVFDSEDELVDLCNDCPFALGSSVFGPAADVARVGQRIDAGMLACDDFA